MYWLSRGGLDCPLYSCAVEQAAELGEVSEDQGRRVPYCDPAMEDTLFGQQAFNEGEVGFTVLHNIRVPAGYL